MTPDITQRLAADPRRKRFAFGCACARRHVELRAGRLVCIDCGARHALEDVSAEPASRGAA